MAELLTQIAPAPLAAVVRARFQPEFERWGMETDVITEVMRDGTPAV